MIRVIIFICIFASDLFTQTLIDPIRFSIPDSLFLKIQRPDKDTIKMVLTRYRISACTRPEAKAFINGKQTKVYPSGAFVGLVDIKTGSNILRFTVKSIAGDSIWKEFVIQRPEPISNSPHDTLVIEQTMMEPSVDLWLKTDDLLEVKFKGSPGWEASFDIPEIESGIPMRELTGSESAGLAGIYVGRYKVQPNDETKAVPITFRLKKSFWSKEKVFSKAKISILPKEFPRTAEVVGKRPFINASLGEDRLGGAKLGFISPGVIVKIVGKVGTQYCVQLSEQMQAWLPEEFAKLLPQDTPLPRSLVGAISASSNDAEDIVTIGLADKLPYTSEQLVNTNAIVLNIYGVASNTNWISQPPSIKGIESITWNQVASDQYKIIIKLHYRQHWGYDVDYVGNSLRLKIRRPPIIAFPDSILDGITIALDAGHGGDNNGAIGATGVFEKDITINIVRHLENILKAKGAKPILTRTEEVGPGNTERIDRIINSHANMLVSIHCNSAGDASDPLTIRGVSTYYRSIGYKSLADIVNEKMLTLGLRQFGVVGSFNFALNSITQMPNVLVETAFISNPEEEMLLLDDEFRKKIAEQIVNGLEEYVKANAEYKTSSK